ncbi:MAG TPA: hypothetical protein VGW75_14755 [Solirubrobacteraceae bacterium]|jgi:hypothetical protein|nr:hypothetical protein [Solirubrobacteraceae bacterium]
MRHRNLHTVLRAFAEDAAAALAAEVAAGEEVPFELAAEGRPRRTQLYCYRPMTGAFIRERLGKLVRLEAYAPAARALAEVDGVDAYLRARGEPRVPRDARDRADAALRAFLDRLFDGSSDFELTAERFGRAYGELEAAVSHDLAPVVTLVVGLPGLLLASPRVELAGGVTLAAAVAVPDAPGDAAWLGAPGDEPNVLAVLTLDDAVAADAAPARLRRLVRTLRLYDAGAVGLAPVAWARLGTGAWQLVDLGGGSPARPGAPLVVAAEQEDELRAFVALASRRMPRGGELAWALRRFDLACERPEAGEALTDVLLALRALLEPEGPGGDGVLADRLAALCAAPEERDALASRVDEAVALERAIVAGLAPPASGVAAVVDELTEHLRALLGDALCGHLDPDLAGAADALLAATAPRHAEPAG